MRDTTIRKATIEVEELRRMAAILARRVGLDSSEGGQGDHPRKSGDEHGRMGRKKK